MRASTCCPRKALTLLVAGAVCLSGCGGDSGGDDDPGEPVEAFYAAYADGDFEKACEQLDEATQEFLKDRPIEGGEDTFGGAPTCERALAVPEGDERRTAAEDVRVTEVEETGPARATVVVEVPNAPEGTETDPRIEVSKDTEGSWKISGFPGAD